VRETLVPVAVAAVLRVTVVPETAVTVVPVAIPVPLTERPTTIVPNNRLVVVTLLPAVVLPVVTTLLPVTVIPQLMHAGVLTCK